MEPLLARILPRGVCARFIRGVNGLDMHILEAGFEPAGRPCLLLLHGFPELAYSWRKVMPALADAGFHVVAPDQRGYGRTTGWQARYDADLWPFRMTNIVLDAVALVAALGERSVAAVIGHDFGAPVAAWCALLRPDLFRSVAIMSAPFAGPPPLPAPAETMSDIRTAFAALPRPRKHYQHYYSTPEAEPEILHCPQGVHAFLRAYYHHKSADWPGNRPAPLAGWTAEELAKLPTYYVMDLHEGMAATVAHEMPSAAAIAACAWLTETELEVYSNEFRRTGFQGGLNWYRCQTGGPQNAELALFAGRAIEVPACFIAGRGDWGVYQVPGALDRMQNVACERLLSCDLVDGAGHWVQQEQPEEVSRRLLGFVEAASRAA
jgi:pimeloyl-ACP methyl ester carboxylesterase